MAVKDMKKALGASLKAEARRVEERFAQAAAVSRDEQPGKGKRAASVKQGRERRRTQVTLAQDEYACVGELKQRCRQAGLSVKKGELLGAGLRLLARLEPDRIADLLGETVPADSRRRAGGAAKKAKGGKPSKADTRRAKDKRANS
jgi:hypothetical protein